MYLPKLQQDASWFAAHLLTACVYNRGDIGACNQVTFWHHPDFIVDIYHPQQPRDESDSAYARINKGKDWNKYKTYLHNQVKELLTNYGKIDILWLDFSYPDSNGHGKDKND